MPNSSASGTNGCLAIAPSLRLLEEYRWPRVEGNVSRLNQSILITSVLLCCWLGMQAIHEGGHVVAAWITGAKVVKVVLHPLTISRTDLGSNPHPLLVVWGGPVGGVLIPLTLWTVAATAKLRGAYLLRFFAGFCLLANGLYIGIGSFWHVGDCGQMLQQGSALWQLWFFGAVTAPAGLWLWHRQGPHFGFGSANGMVSPRMVYLSFLVSVLLAGAGFLFGQE